MSDDIGPPRAEERHGSGQPAGGQPAGGRAAGGRAGEFVLVALSCGPLLIDYAGELLGDPAAAPGVVESVLATGAARLDAQHHDSVRLGLYAAVRRECQARRSRRRATDRDQPSVATSAGQGTDRADMGGPSAQEPVTEDLTGEVAVADLEAEERRRRAAVAAQVLRGLPEPERETLSLAIRHGMGEEDLGAILGIPPRRAQADLSQARAQFVRLAATVVLLYLGWPGCQRLDEIVGDSPPAWPGDRLCRRVARHSKSCGACGQAVTSRGLGPDALALLPLEELTPGLRRRLASASATGSAATKLDIASPAAVSRPRAEPGSRAADLVTARPGPRVSAIADHPDQAPAAGVSSRPWLRGGLTRPRAGVLSAAAVLVIVAGVLLAGKLAIPAADDSGRAAAVTSTSALSSPPAGAQRPASADVSPHRSRAARPRTITTTVPIPGRSGFPTYSPPVTPSPRPSSSRPSPSPTTKHSESPSPTPTPTPTTPTPTPDPSPTTTSPAPSQTT